MYSKSTNHPIRFSSATTFSNTGSVYVCRKQALANFMLVSKLRCEQQTQIISIITTDSDACIFSKGKCCLNYNNASYYTNSHALHVKSTNLYLHLLVHSKCRYKVAQHVKVQGLRFRMIYLQEWNSIFISIFSLLYHHLNMRIAVLLLSSTFL